MEIGIKYRPYFDAFPPLERIRPYIPEEHRRLAKQSPPPALPLHCKPWVDANSHGLLLRYPYRSTLTIIGREDDLPEARMSPRSSYRVYGPLGLMFSKDHFSLGSGYWFLTDPGIGIYTNVLPQGYEPKGQLVPGLVETWRYPKRLFVVFRTPSPGETMTFEYGDPLSMLLPLACGRLSVNPMTDDEWSDFQAVRHEWDERLEQHPELRWTSADRIHFTHMYKVFGKQQRTKLEEVDG